MGNPWKSIFFVCLFWRRASNSARPETHAFKTWLPTERHKMFKRVHETHAFKTSHSHDQASRKIFCSCWLFKLEAVNKHFWCTQPEKYVFWDFIFMTWNKQLNHSHILEELEDLLPVICHILVVFRYIEKFDLSAQWGLINDLGLSSRLTTILVS